MQRVHREPLRAGLISSVLLLLAVAGAVHAEWGVPEGILETPWTSQVSPEQVLPEYPRPTMVRSDWLNLNGLWQFAIADRDEEPPHDRDLDGEILVPFPIESPLSGVMKAADHLWYRRLFEVPGEWQNDRILLHFGAVDWEASVYVNGKMLGTHRGGFDSFTFDITDALNPSGQQELVVGVFDPTEDGDQPRGKQKRKRGWIFYTAVTGIWQTVWLEPVPAARIGQLHLIPDVDAGCLRLRVSGEGTGWHHHVRAVASTENTEVGEVAGSPGAELVLPIPDARLWSPDNPFLYDLTVTLSNGDHVVDQVESYFGMRKIGLGKDENGITRIMLNGQPVFQVGLLDQGYWPDGLYTAPTDEALRYDIDLTKQLGFNMIRKHAKVEPERWYSWCDRQGLLVWQDMPHGRNTTPEGREQFERELRRMIEGRANHPSIVMWIVFNEGWGQYDTNRLTEMARRLDPSRLINSASGSLEPVSAGDVSDIHKYPGPVSPEPQADRAAVLGEFGGLALAIPGHTWGDRAWGYRHADSMEELTSHYMVLMSYVWRFQRAPGLSASVYTQITDVESECNGLLTYDRKVIKVDREMTIAANQDRLPKVEVIVPTESGTSPQWLVAVNQPAQEWFQPKFDDSLWMKGLRDNLWQPQEKRPGIPPQQVPENVWLRRSFSLERADLEGYPFLLLRSTERVEVYVNGVLAATDRGGMLQVAGTPMTREARDALVEGTNVFAVHCQAGDKPCRVEVGLARIPCLDAMEN